MVGENKQNCLIDSIGIRADYGDGKPARPLEDRRLQSPAVLLRVLFYTISFGST